jgi:hypothetical protein
MLARRLPLRHYLKSYFLNLIKGVGLAVRNSKKVAKALRCCQEAR